MSDPIEWAAAFGQLHTVMALTKNGANPERNNWAGNNAFVDAARERHAHVSAWLEQWRELQQRRPDPMYTLLNCAEVQAVLHADALHIWTVTGKLLYSERKDDITSLQVDDVIKSIAARVSVDLRDVDIKLVAGMRTLEPQDKLWGFLQGEGNTELTVIFDLVEAQLPKESE